jgi:hypothetical protein
MGAEQNFYARLDKLTQDFERFEAEQNNRLAGILANQPRQMDIADRFDSIHRRPENVLEQFPPWEADPAVPVAQNVEVIKEDQKVAETHLAVRFTNPDPAQVSHFEVYVTRSSFDNEEPAKVWEGRNSPAVFSVSADIDTTVVGRVRTVMKGGVGGSDYESSPSFAASILKLGVGASDIINESIGDAKLDRVTDPIAILSADITSLTAGKISAGSIASDVAVLGTVLAGQIQTGSIAADVAVLGTVAAGQIQAGSIASDVAVLGTVAAGQIQAGTIASNVAVLGTVVASQIAAGTISAVNVSAGTFSLTSGNNTMSIDGTNGFSIDNTVIDVFAALDNGQFSIRNMISNNRQTFIDVDTVKGLNSNGNIAWRLRSDTEDLGEANSGYLAISDAVASDRVELGVTGGNNGYISVTNDTGSESVIVGSDGNLGQADSGYVACNNAAGTVKAQMGVQSGGADGKIAAVGTTTVDIVAWIDGTHYSLSRASSTAASNGLYVNGNQVVGPRETDPGSSPTTEQLRQVLLGHGLI